MFFFIWLVFGLICFWTNGGSGKGYLDFGLNVTKTVGKPKRILSILFSSFAAVLRMRPHGGRLPVSRQFLYEDFSHAQTLRVLCVHISWQTHSKPLGQLFLQEGGGRFLFLVRGSINGGPRLLVPALRTVGTVKNGGQRESSQQALSYRD